MTTAEMLKKFRISQELTQAVVAHRAEMSTVQYNGYERGRHEPSDATLDRLARALGTTARKLRGAEDLVGQDATADSLIEALRRRVAQDANWNPERVRVMIQLE